MKVRSTVMNLCGSNDVAVFAKRFLQNDRGDKTMLNAKFKMLNGKILLNCQGYLIGVRRCGGALGHWAQSVPIIKIDKMQRTCLIHKAALINHCKAGSGETACRHS